MTEHRIFEILLQNNKNTDYSFDYPKLQENSVRHVAKKFTDIIYETLKQKSSASSIKRGNVLKFINSLCEVKESHLNEESYKCFLREVKNHFKVSVDENVSKLFCDINSDLNRHKPKTFADEVISFYERKHSRQKEKVKGLEFIKMMDQEKVIAKHDIQVTKKFSYYETNEKLIRDLLTEVSCNGIETRTPLQQIEDTGYREKQMKLAYALVNLKNEDTILVGKILQRLSGYTNLQEYEVNFVQYLWVTEDINIISPEDLAAKFPFILERIILKHCTELLLVQENIDINEYFMNLENNEKFSKIRKIYQNNPVIYYTLKNLIYELYSHSYCNKNILKLADFII